LKEPYTGPIALDPVATSATFFFSLARAVSGTAVMEGYSPLKNKKGKEVGGKELTIYDNGILKGGWNSRRYDDEGVPRQNTILIVKGVLKSYIHNTYTARAMDEESTGNAFRQRGLLDVGITNLYIKPSNKSVDKLLSSYDSLIYIKNLPMGVHTTNYITGTINMVSTEAYIVKKGSIEGVLRPVTITGNIYEAMKEIEVADDLKETFYYTYSPTIVLGKFTIA
jgi:PmbA protein